MIDSRNVWAACQAAWLFAALSSPWWVGSGAVLAAEIAGLVIAQLLLILWVVLAAR